MSRCPACGVEFECGANAAEPCWCCRVTLDAAQRDALAQRYVGCLCPACLQKEPAPPDPPLNARNLR
jgi:hypothetical protein